jgi:hypothetical protein
MGLGRWLRNKMEADDGYKPDPDEIVTVGYVSLAVSNIVLTELKAAGIRAEVVEQRLGYHGPAQARILCFAGDREAAATIIDRF